MYLADAAGNASSTDVWMGGCLEDLTPEATFESVRMAAHGDPYGRDYHVDESHVIAIQNLWVLEARQLVMPSIRRNQQYVMVIRWLDEATEAWCKRTYYGVTGMFQGLSVVEETFYENLKFGARRMEEFAGYMNPPDLTVSKVGQLRYVTASDSVVLYSYDFGGGVFAVVDPALLAGRAEIETGVGEWKLLFGASVAMRVTADGLEVKTLTAAGGTFPQADAYPRVEFWDGPRRFAALTAAGELCAPHVAEAEEDPGLADDFAIAVGGDWAASIAAGKVYAKGFSDDL